jgi:Mg-chelatase subunit ChlD
MINKIYTLSLIFALTIFSGNAQKYFTITLLDFETYEPVEDAIVEIKLGVNKSTLSQKTNVEGKVTFNISNTQINDHTSYDFKISAEGYYGPSGVIILKHPLDRIHMIKKIPEFKKPEEKIVEEVENEQSDVINNISTKIENLTNNKISSDVADNNFVFLIDVSASMNHPQRLPVLKESLKYMVSLYRDSDFITLITYASSAEIILNPISAKYLDTIHQVIDSLKTYGKTMGGVGLELAYETAVNNFLKNGNNKVIIATDGAFTNDKKQDKLMLEIVDKGLNNNVKLSSLAFGKIEPKDIKRLKILTQRGKGNFYHIDNLEEAKQYLIKEATSEKRTENQ